MCCHCASILTKWHLQGFRFLVMERLGRTLGDIVSEHGAIPSSTAARLGLEIVRGVSCMEVNVGD